MNEFMQKIKYWSLDLITSGLPLDYDIYILRKFIIINLLLVFGSGALFIFSIIALIEDYFILCVADATFFLILMWSLYILRKKKIYTFIGIFGTIFVGLFFLFFVAYIDVERSVYLWILTYPIVALFILGKKIGSYFSAIFLLLICIFFFFGGYFHILQSYDIDIITRLVGVYILLHLMALATEIVWENVHNKLVSEIINRYKVESQLSHAQKMEAIGVLAGGVAHDLNNILSSIVTYPDIIFLDLPDDSPIRAPLETIQESGMKAAAIVKDMLTLARRDIATNEVSNLNNIIVSFVNSIECKNIKNHHPGVLIELDLQPDLRNIIGSSIHLTKTVMNLISNAAEAINNAGSIRLSTKNHDINTTIDGYEKIPVGDYVVLTISDSGSGISSQDMGKIFEPFYTKKKMGRSGTGLGMTVVWGTVKDLKGYIDIKSVLGTGTSISLYFPVTQKRLPDIKEKIPIGNYMGNEKVLIVDDSEDQREIASAILKKLGYSVAVASSGEEAVTYLTQNHADILILDMIMDPGIDGLETYKRIIEIHPSQAAIIASGYSEDKNVKETQKLGAGEFIMKPYTMEKLGIAIRAQLDK